MRPTESELSERDLLSTAKACARERGLTLAELFGRSRSPTVTRARAAFYGALRGLGWSDGEIGRLCGRDGSTVRYALMRRNEGART